MYGVVALRATGDGPVSADWSIDAGPLFGASNTGSLR